jgi:uncharacterized protein YjdB
VEKMTQYLHVSFFLCIFAAAKMKRNKQNYHLTHIIMRKIFTLVALTVISAVSWAASITVNPTTVDFGEVSIKGKPSVEGTATIHVSFSGLQPYCGVAFEDVSSEMPEDGASFWLDGTKTAGWIYGGDTSTPAEGEGLTLHYYADQAGTYTGKMRFYTYEDANWEVESESVYLTMKVVVTDEAIVAKTTPYERINSTSELKSGDTIVFVSESEGAVSGPLYTTYLQSVTEGVKIANGKADVPETAQSFVLSQYGGNWQLTATGTDNRLSLDVTGKGAFTYATPVANQILAGWGISISNGTAYVSRPDETFPVEFNDNRFRPYKSPLGSTIQLYKKAGEAQEIQSKLEIEPISFGDVELDENKSVTVNYTGENLTEDIIWLLEGSDAGLFGTKINGDRNGGTITILYKGKGKKTGKADARLSYLTLDAKLDVVEGSANIDINLIAATVKLTKIEFVGAPESIDQGASIDMSQYLVFTPGDAEDKSLVWMTDHDYQGTVDENGVLTAKHVTGNVAVTATSVRMPDVSATCILAITVPEVTDFTLSESEITLSPGGTHTLSVATYVPDYATASPTYASSNTDVATVNKKGVITAKNLGEAEITATIGKVVKTCAVHVVPVSVTCITFEAAEANLTLGSTLQLSPVVTPAEAAAQYTITYSSDNESVATVDAHGKVTSVAEGDAVITATISDKSAQITIHVTAAKTFAKVNAASELAAKDTIILALQSVPVIAGPRDNKKLSVLLEDVTVTDSEAFAENACRMVLGTEKNKEGFTLTIVGASKPIAVTSTGNDIVDANTTNCKMWEFVEDDGKGVFIRNLGNTNAMFKYQAGNAAVKPYKINTAGAVYVYVYVRKYVDPGQGIEDIEESTPAQKILREGQILILRNGLTYTIEGKRL